jgi:ABC-type transporter Mla subunit MlaD
MSDFDPKDDLKVPKLVNAYSIQEITAIFSEIDQKIQSLHSCSNEDFLTLNAYFKKYYADSKTISANASNLFAILTTEETRTTFFYQLEKFQRSLQDLLNIYEQHQTNIVQSLDNTIQEMELMFVTANNLKQDLMTLKLLVANLKLDIIISADPTNRMARKTNDFNELIIQTKSFFIEFYKNSNQFKELIKNLSSQISQQSERNQQNINELLNEIYYSSNLLDQKYDEASQNIPKLTESTRNTSDSIAKIITNLQYQDIIRQKIEHIQTTHKEVLSQLKDIKETDDEETKLQHRIKWYLQIRDIAGLQSAQLIHANKEYQKAIEVISGRFLEVGTDMTQISNLCYQITGNNTSNKFSHFDEIKENFEKSSYIIDILTKSSNYSKDKIRILQTELDEIINKYYELSDFIKTIYKSISKALDNPQSIKGEHFETTLHQIRTILVDMQGISNLYQSQFEKIKRICENIAETTIQQNENNRKLDTAISDFSEQYTIINTNLNTTNENVYKILNENQLLSNRISSDIKSSIEQIKYYDLFDKVIEEIILKLNEINIKLQSIEDSTSGTANETLESLKKRYTMQSEHIIHDNLSSHKNIDLQHLDSTGIDEDDDNLELF